MHRAEVFTCKPLEHRCILDTIIMCPEHWGDPIHQVDLAAVVCKLALFSVEYDVALPMDACFSYPHLGIIEYLNNRMPKNKAPAVIFPMDVIRWECFFL